jgi:hypothetical protein
MSRSSRIKNVLSLQVARERARQPKSGSDCGDRVRERNGCHFGRVEAILHGAWVKVGWEDSGWCSTLPRGDIVRDRSEP